MKKKPNSTNEFSANNNINNVKYFFSSNKKKMMLFFIAVCSCIITISLFVFPTSDALFASGSTTLQPLMLNLASSYKETKQVNVAGGGSTLGINFIQQNLTDIGDASRYPKSSEYNGSDWNNTYTCPIALDTFVFVVNIPGYSSTNNQINLTADQLYDIYSGKITNWNLINSSLPNFPILAVNREEGSGTKSAFYNSMEYYEGKKLEGTDFPKSGIVAVSNGQVANNILATKGSIGYLSFGYIRLFFNSAGNIKINNSIYFPNIFYSENDEQDNTKALLPTGIYFDKGIANKQNKMDFFKNTSNRIINDNKSETNAFWHPMNLIISSGSEKFKETSQFIKWVYSDVVQNEIFDLNYLPVKYYWWKDVKGFYPIAFKKNDKQDAPIDTKTWIKDILQTTDDTKNKKVATEYNNTHSTWWAVWIGADGLYE